MQKLLNDARIGWDHAANGFFTNSARHLGTHTNKFIRFLHSELMPLAGNRKAIIEKLREIADLLRKGKLKF